MHEGSLAANIKIKFSSYRFIIFSEAAIGGSPFSDLRKNTQCNVAAATSAGNFRLIHRLVMRPVKVWVNKKFDKFIATQLQL